MAENDDAATGNATASEAEPRTEPGGIRSTTITIGDLVFEAREAGPDDGELVILLHGFPQTSAMWRPQLTALGEAGYHVIAPDQRGYSPGARPEAVEDYEMDDIAADTLGMADALGADTFHLVGHDWGGAVGWVLAADAPERLLTMTSISNPHATAIGSALEDPASDQLTRSDYAFRYLSSGSEKTLLFDDAAELRDIYAAAGLSQEEVDEQLAVLGNDLALIAAMNWYRTTWVSTFRPPGSSKVPSMFIWSTHDDPLGPDPAYRTAALYDESLRFEVLSGVNHWVPNVAAEDTTALLLQFLADPTPVGGGEESATISNLRDEVYCDLIVNGDVLTTRGIGRCEAAAWEAIEPEMVSQSQPENVIRDGLRVSMAERQVSTVISRSTELIRGIWFRRDGSYDVDPATAETMFEARPIPGGSELIFAAGDQIVELTDEAGQRWVMESFLAGDDGPFSTDEWIESGAVDGITVPSGWDLAVTRLEADLTISGQGETAAILHDNLSGTYLLATG